MYMIRMAITSDLLALAACAALLAGCVSPQQQFAMDQQSCQSFGFAPGTTPFAQCMMSVAQQRQAEDDTYRQIWEINNSIAAQNQIDSAAAAAAAAGSYAPGLGPPSVPNFVTPQFSGMPVAPSFPGMHCTKHTYVQGDTTRSTENCRN
jgi:hypothetical protein